MKKNNAAGKYLKNDKKCLNDLAVSILLKQQEIGRDLTDKEIEEATYWMFTAYGAGIIYAKQHPKKQINFLN